MKTYAAVTTYFGSGMRSQAWQVLAFIVLLAAAAWAVVLGGSAMPYRWQWERVPPFVVRSFNGTLYPGPLLKGLLVTVEVSLWAIGVALAAGCAAALLRLSRSPVGGALARLYVELVRNTPLLVQLYLAYFVVGPILGLDRQLVAILSLGLFEGAFAAEIIRAGILSVPGSQTEAARSLGLRTGATYRLVVLPQAVRIVLPPLASLGISTVKHSAIVSVVAIFDLTNEGRTLIADTFMTFEIWLTVAALYLVLTTALSALAAVMERRLGRTLAFQP